MGTQSEATGSHLGGPGNYNNHDELVGVVVLASMEVRHAGEAVWQHFASVHSLVDVAKQMAALDEAAFIGVITFSMLLGLFITDVAMAVWRKIRALLRQMSE